MPLLIQALAAGRTQQGALATTIGWVLTVSGLAETLATPLWGRLGDTYGHVRVLLVAVLLVSLSLLGQHAASSLLAFAVVRTIYGAVQVALTALPVAALAILTLWAVCPHLIQYALTGGPHGRLWVSSDGGNTWALHPLRARGCAPKEAPHERHAHVCRGPPPPSSLSGHISTPRPVIGVSGATPPV